MTRSSYTYDEYDIAIRDALGKRVRAIRKDAHLTLDQAARLIGSHGTYLSGLERGRAMPRLSILFRIADALKVDPCDLLPTDEEILVEMGKTIDRTAPYEEADE